MKCLQSDVIRVIYRFFPGSLLWASVKIIAIVSIIFATCLYITHYEDTHCITGFGSYSQACLDGK